MGKIQPIESTKTMKDCIVPFNYKLLSSSYWFQLFDRIHASVELTCFRVLQPCRNMSQFAEGLAREARNVEGNLASSK